MIIQHKKSGKLYQLMNDNCMARFNGKWYNAVCYRDIDEEGIWKWYIIDWEHYEKCFIPSDGVKTNESYPACSDMLYILEKVAKEYPGKTIENIIVQMEAKLKEIGNSAAKQ